MPLSPYMINSGNNMYSILGNMVNIHRDGSTECAWRDPKLTHRNYINNL